MLFRRRFDVMSDEAGAGGAAVVAPKEPEAFSKEYVRELREENKGWRLRAQESEQKAMRAAEEVALLRQSANERVVRAELRAAAVKAGMVDLDGLKLADLSTVTLADDGGVVGADELMAHLREAKPYLFGAGRSSANPNPAPVPKASEPKDARKLSDSAYKAARAALISGF